MLVQNSLPSLEETPKFLRAMRNVSATQCDCLPDCESTTFQYSVSSNNFMWAAFFLCPNYGWSKLVQGMWLSQPQHQPTLHFGERTAPKTLAWGGGQLGNRWKILFPWSIVTDSNINSRALFFSATWKCIQVTKKYEESYESIPSYISSLPSPMRKRRQDQLIGTQAIVKDG